MFDINSITFESIPSRIVEIGEKLAEYTSVYENLSEMSKVILASIQNEIQGEGLKFSEAERTRIALGSPSYKDHLDGLKVARQNMLIHRAYMQALESKFEYCRSLNSLRKAEMRM